MITCLSNKKKFKKRTTVLHETSAIDIGMALRQHYFGKSANSKLTYNGGEYFSWNA